MNGSFVGMGKEGSSVRGTSTSPTINEDKHDADGGTGKDISREGTGGSSKGEPLRRAVGLQDFVFGEVIGRGSYSTVSAWDSCKSESHCSFSLLMFIRSFPFASVYSLAVRRILDPRSLAQRFSTRVQYFVDPASCAPTSVYAHSRRFRVFATRLPRMTRRFRIPSPHFLLMATPPSPIHSLAFASPRVGHPRNSKSNTPPLRHQNTRPVSTRPGEKDKVRKD
jgi:hypothetical protein